MTVCDSCGLFSAEGACIGTIACYDRFLSFSGVENQLRTLIGDARMWGQEPQKIRAEIVSRVNKGTLQLQSGRIPSLTQVQAVCKGIDRKARDDAIWRPLRGDPAWFCRVGC